MLAPAIGLFLFQGAVTHLANDMGVLMYLVLVMMIIVGALIYVWLYFAQFALNGVIKCWTEGVQRMKVGGKAQLVCPSDLAYGDQGRPSIPGGATLIFEIELLSIGGS